MRPFFVSRKRSPMIRMLSDDRLLFSIAFSVLLHTLVLFPIVFFMQAHLPLKQREKATQLQVNLIHPIKPTAPAKHNKNLLALAGNAKLRTTQLPIQNAQDEPGNVPIGAQASPLAGVEPGIAFPSASSRLILGVPGGNHAFLRPRPVQQHAAQNLYQQAMAAQTKQQVEQHRHHSKQQLLQRLAQLLAGNETLRGRCVLAEAEIGAELGTNANKQLTCDSAALFELIKTEKSNLIDRMIALREWGDTLTGFSIGLHEGHVGTILIQDE